MKNSDKTIFRAPHNEANPYSKVNIEYAYSLGSLKEIGLLTLLLGNTDNFKIHKSEILGRLNVNADTKNKGKSSFNSAWKSLEEKGHILKVGEGSKSKYYIYEAPLKGDVKSEQISSSEKDLEIERLRKELNKYKTAKETVPVEEVKEVIENKPVNNVKKETDIVPLKKECKQKSNNLTLPQIIKELTVYVTDLYGEEYISKIPQNTKEAKVWYNLMKTDQDLPIEIILEGEQEDEEETFPDISTISYTPTINKIEDPDKDYWDKLDREQELKNKEKFKKMEANKVLVNDHTLVASYSEVEKELND